ncbi:hypothetical protein EYR41_007964 [Orbilia oligospora]|uniref:Peroxisomal membrane protein PEX14 n=1 Tax=Orbilia oligospora TaxID=2813651 RepID=A0A7C8PRN8_ORBOL|nr:hypothetical protein TWF751_002700 [Orbilia oligospora]TGJ66320.1 hypothetical protein EYR41_007964 [Orbilia oligospora]
MANDTDPKGQPSEPQSSPAEPTPSLSPEKEPPAAPAPTPVEPITPEPEPEQEQQPEQEQEQKESIPLTRSQLIEQALRFLQESEVQNSTRTKKIAFLESKGLTRDEIDGLLPVEKGVPSWQLPKSGLKKPMVQAEPPMPPMPSESSAGAGSSSRAHRNVQASSMVSTGTSTYPQTPLPPRPNASAPIVTFPEYLPPPPPPPPIFNTATLTAGAYLFAGVSATIYAATKYYFQPLLDNLTDSRLEFTSHTLSKLDEMNQKLSDLAHRPLPSETHPNPPFGVLQHKYPLAKYTTRTTSDTFSEADLLDDEADRESIYSYASSTLPTRTFHVDAQTQTSPHHSIASASDPTSLPPDEKLDRIHRLLKSLKDEADDVVQSDGGELGGNVKDLTEYLHNITYKATYGGNSANSYLPPYVSISGGAGAQGKGDEDEFGKVKAEIRSVKGVLLNIKNFPAGSR